MAPPFKLERISGDRGDHSIDPYLPNQLNDWTHWAYFIANMSIFLYCLWFEIYRTFSTLNKKLFERSLKTEYLHSPVGTEESHEHLVQGGHASTENLRNCMSECYSLGNLLGSVTSWTLLMYKINISSQYGSVWIQMSSQVTPENLNHDEGRVLTKTKFVFSSKQHKYGVVWRYIFMYAYVSFIHEYSFSNPVILNIEETLVDVFISQ
jgi:hypothetical protein